MWYISVSFPRSGTGRMCSVQRQGNGATSEVTSPFQNRMCCIQYCIQYFTKVSSDLEEVRNAPGLHDLQSFKLASTLNNVHCVSNSFSQRKMFYSAEKLLPLAVKGVSQTEAVNLLFHFIMWKCRGDLPFWVSLILPVK